MGQPTAGPVTTRPKGYEELKALSAKLGRAIKNLIGLTTPNDPFLAGSPARFLAAIWFAEMWERFDMKAGSHVRRLHYIMVSQEPPIMLPSGEPYVNTTACSRWLHHASADARYLGLIEGGLIIDRRNPRATINLADEAEVPATIAVSTGFVWSPTSEQHQKTVLGLPRIRLEPPAISQRYHLEIWCEKSTMNDDVLLPIGDRYGINVVTAAGEMSLTACELLVERARESGRPVRIFYISDFDPAGVGMPVSVARKIEFLIRSSELDIQVRVVALTYEQCVEYRLPRIPIKETETRGAKFEARFGEGGTELDALEALHPGVLMEMIEAEIGKYYDSNLDDNIRDVVREAERDIAMINAEVRRRYVDEIAELEAESDSINAEAEEAQRRRTEREAALTLRAQPLLDKMIEELEEEAPDADNYDWPEPEEADEDFEALFDSTRSYLEQIDHYREHRGEEEHTDPTCEECGETFKSVRGGRFCCREHQQTNYRRRMSADGI
jgi:hypothetical protein